MEMSEFPPLTSLICIFTLIFLTRSLLAYTDPFYLACSVPKICGDGQIISYPFYIEGQQEPYCGYPGFQLSCNSQGNPVLKQLSNDSSYIVEEIFYENQSLRVSNAALYTDPSACDFPRIRNVSLPQDPFWLALNQTEVVLLYNCNSPLPQKLLQYELRRGGNCSDQTGTVLAMSEDNSDLGYASGECRDKVVAPVNVNVGEYHDHGDGLGTEEIIRRGFLLNWMASNCSVCEESGGKCGFNASTYHFNCYCPDRIHAKHCIPGKFFSFLSGNC